jgi:hypothetical protein
MIVVVNEHIVKFVCCCQSYSDKLDYHERNSYRVRPYIRGIVSELTSEFPPGQLVSALVSVGSSDFSYPNLHMVGRINSNFRNAI